MELPPFHRLGLWLHRHPKVCIAAGNLESRLLALGDDDTLSSPVYICGLARSGTTLLLEMLASHPDVATHRYQDFPFVCTPYWWNTLLALNPLRRATLSERAHGDGMMVSGQSPEAMEEMLWMAFFDHLHDTAHSSVLDASCENAAFTRFYREHIKKLLLVCKRRRYVSKGNYNISRMAYLHALFPDARFILPVRNPVDHIASLMRQHVRFCEAGRRDRRVAGHMSAVGHFEFGLNRIPIHTGDTARIRDIQDAWERGEEVRGWALYWDMIYRFAHDQLQALPSLKKQVYVVPYETLYGQPQKMIANIMDHAQLHGAQELISRWAAATRKPDYYRHGFSQEDVSLIRELTSQTASLYGYEAL